MIIEVVNSLFLKVPLARDWKTLKRPALNGNGSTIKRPFCGVGCGCTTLDDHIRTIRNVCSGKYIIRLRALSWYVYSNNSVCIWWCLWHILHAWVQITSLLAVHLSTMLCCRAPRTKLIFSEQSSFDTRQY